MEKSLPDVGFMNFMNNQQQRYRPEDSQLKHKINLKWFEQYVFIGSLVK